MGSPWKNSMGTVPPDATDGIVCRGETVPGLGWRTFFAIPVDKLKFDMQRTPVEVRAEFGRARRRTTCGSWDFNRARRRR